MAGGLTPAMCDRRNTMVSEAVFPTPYQHIPVFEEKPRRRTPTTQFSPQKYRWQPKRYRHHRPAKILFVPILVQPHSGARLIAINQTDIRLEPRVTSPGSCIPCQLG